MLIISVSNRFLLINSQVFAAVSESEANEKGSAVNGKKRLQGIVVDGKKK